MGGQVDYICGYLCVAFALLVLVGGGLPLFIELPRRGVPGNWASGIKYSRKLKPRVL